jgi:hypothetical protein
MGLGHSPVLRLHVVAVERQLLLSSPVRGNLRGTGATQAGFLEMLLNLLAARAVRLQVLARISLDLWRAILPDLQFVTELLDAPGKLGSIYSGPVLLGPIELLRLDCPEFPITRFRHVEENGMGVQLRRGVAVDRTRRVVLELRYRPIVRVLGSSVAPHTRLDVRLHLVDGDTNGLPMRLSHSLIASHKRGERHALWRGKRCVPSCSVAHRLDRLAVAGLVLVRKPLLDQLLAGAWMPAFGHPSEVVLTHLALQPEVRRKAALPLPANILVLRVIGLSAAGKFLRVIPLRLSRTQRTRDGEHQSKYGISPTTDSAWPCTAALPLSRSRSPWPVCKAEAMS